MRNINIKMSPRDESWLHGGEVAVPLEITAHGDCITVEFYPSAKPLVDEYLRCYGKSWETLFSAEAVSFAADEFEMFLSSWGFSMSPDSRDYYLRYTVSEPSGEILPEVCRITGDEGFTDLTGTDIAALVGEGYIIYAAVIDEKIVALANTGEPVNEDTPREVEIGVDTADEYRRRGFGRACVAALVRELERMGHIAAYECASKNTASIKLVESIGGELKLRKFYIVGFSGE